jgi:amino acid transporter
VSEENGKRGDRLTCRDIGLVAAAYLGWKVVKRSKYVRLVDIPIEEVLEQIQPEEDVEAKSTGWVRMVSWLWD